MIIQFCGLSGSGKTTLANAVRDLLHHKGILVEVIDGDEYRKELCADLGFSKEDRCENIRRLAFVANKFSFHGILPIICAINPFEEIRAEVREKYHDVKTVFIDCGLETLVARDTKGLYRLALLPDHNPLKIRNLTGINDPFENPMSPDLVIKTDHQTKEDSTQRLFHFILNKL